MRKKWVPERHIICRDAITWLKKQPDDFLPTVVTGIPDLNELGLKDSKNYERFFKTAADLIMRKVANDQYVIFIQTDRKYKGTWIDKSYWLNQLAEKNGLKLLWNKIVINKGVDKVELHRPGYSRMMAFSKKGTPGKATPDVILRGKTIYENATSVNAAEMVMKILQAKKKREKINAVLDPFCGRGTVAAMANKYGLTAYCIDIDKKQCEYAKKLQF